MDMKIKWKKSDGAVSEVIGAILMVGIGVALFSILYFIVMSYPFTPPVPSVDIVGSIEGDSIVLEHRGGDSLDQNATVSFIVGGTRISKTVHDLLNDSNGNHRWDIGELLVYYNSSMTNLQVEATVIDMDSNSIVMTAVLQEGETTVIPSYDGIDSNTSDVDGSVDKGSETNFPNAQGITNDGNSMTIQEAETAGQIHMTAVQGNTCDVDSSPDKGNETNFANAQGTTTDTKVMTIQETLSNDSSSIFGQTTARTSTTTLDGEICGLNATAAGGTNGKVDYIMAYLEKSSSTGTTWTVKASLYYQSNSTYIATTEERTITPSTSWVWYKFNFTGTKPTIQNGVAYRIFIWANNPTGTLQLGTYTSTSAFKRGFKASTYGSWPSSMTGLTYANGDYSLYCSYTPLSYKIDFEYNWSKANFSDSAEYLCFYVTSHTGSETLNINYRSGATWTSLGTITTTGWKNVTATGLTSNTYTIQLIGATESGDTSQDSWSIDCIFLNTYNASNYQIDFEYQWTAALYKRPNKQVCLYVASHTGTENLLVNYWTGTAWSSLGTITTTGWSNFTATGLTSLIYTIQLKGASESGDAVKDSWNIDVIMLHTWN